VEWEGRKDKKRKKTQRKDEEGEGRVESESAGLSLGRKGQWPGFALERMHRHAFGLQIGCRSLGR
jgi:hypothetical protein